MAYIKGKPLSVRYSLRLPLSSVKEGFYLRLRYGWHQPIQGRVRLSTFAEPGSSLSSVGGFFQPLPNGWLWTLVCLPVSEKLSSRLCRYGRLSASEKRAFPRGLKRWSCNRLCSPLLVSTRHNRPHREREARFFRSIPEACSPFIWLLPPVANHT